jgi:hypothetical protein
MLYRVWSDGAVDYLKVSAEECNNFPNGVPDWAEFNIDKAMTRDRQGHPQPKRK